MRGFWSRRTVHSSEDLVRAAGGVIWRRSPEPGGDLEIVLVHRPSYDDWSLPKGKADPGESDQRTALREVEEECGLACRIGPELPSTFYRDKHGRPKVVRYWAMTPESGEVKADNEVDDAGWFPLDAARRMLSYERDREVVDALAGALD